MLWSLAKAAAFLGLLGFAAWLLFQNQVHSKLLATIQSKCDLALHGSGIHSEIGNAQFLEGRGLLLTNVRARTPNISIEAYEAFFSMPGSTTDLVIGACDLDAIDMRRVKFDIYRSANESFDFTGLVQTFRRLAQDKKRCSKIVPVRVRDSILHMVDRVSGIEKTVSDINIDITPVSHEGRTILQVQLSASSKEIQQLALNALVDPDSKEWKGQLTLSNARVETELLALLPRSMQQKLDLVTSVAGQIDSVTFNAEGNFNAPAETAFHGSGTFSRFMLDHRKLPDTIRNAYANFELGNHELRLTKVFANMGQAQLTGDYSQAGLTFPSQWWFKGKLERFNFDGSERMMRLMTEGGKRFCNEFRPHGQFDFEIETHFDGSRVNKKIVATINDLGFKYFRFPYPVEDANGTVRWDGDRIVYDLRVNEKDREIRAAGFVNKPGPDATYRCDIEVLRGSLPFDEKLMTAIDANETMGKVVREFNAHGSVAGKGTIQKFVPGGKARKTYEIDLVDLSIRHLRFPYSILGVRGKIKTNDSAFTLENLTGSNGRGRVLCNGRWNPDEGLIARYICNDIQLDDELRQALRDELKEVWDGFRPRGKVELLTVDMTLPFGSRQCNLIVDATLHGQRDGRRVSDLSIYPTWFPYRLEDLAGRINIGNGKVSLKDFRGKHGGTSVVCQGEGSYSEFGWDVRLSNLLASSLRFEDSLLRALPESLAKSIEYLKFDGLTSVTGAITLAGVYKKKAVPQFANQIPTSNIPVSNNGAQYANRGYVRQASASREITVKSMAPNVSMGWDVSFAMNDAEMFLGIPVRNIFGAVNLMGQYDGKDVECSGDLALESLTIYEAQITNVRGPVWFDNYQALAGGLINQLSRSTALKKSVSGNLYGGQIKLDAAIATDEEGRFLLETEIRNADLKQVSQDFAPSQKDIEGRTFGGLRMRGNASGSHSCQGNGWIQVRDARIELPPVVRLLRLDSGDIVFAVNGEEIDLNRMEFNGDAISLIGNGRVNLNHDLDLNFYSVVGRNRVNIPLISDLYRRGSQKFMWIKVDGNLSEPRLSREMLPELNDSIRQLFQQK